MNLKDFTAAFDPDTFLLSTEGQKTRVFVNPNLVYKSVGSPPRRISFRTQDEFHDAHYSWQEKSGQFSKSILDVLSSKIQGASLKTISHNAWNKPFLAIE